MLADPNKRWGLVALLRTSFQAQILPLPNPPWRAACVYTGVVLHQIAGYADVIFIVRSQTVVRRGTVNVCNTMQKVFRVTVVVE